MQRSFNAPLSYPSTAFAHCGNFHLLRAPLAGCYISLRFAIDINCLFNCLTCRPPITAECGNFCALPVVREDFRSVEKYLLLLPSLAGSRPNWPNSDLVLLPFFSHTHHWNKRNIFYSIDFEKLFIPLLFQALHTKVSPVGKGEVEDVSSCCCQDAPLNNLPTRTTKR